MNSHETTRPRKPRQANWSHEFTRMIIPYESLWDKPQKVEISSEAEHVLHFVPPLPHHPKSNILVELVGIQRLDADILDSVWASKQHARRICWVGPKTITTSTGGRYLVGRSARQHGPLERSAGHVGTCVRNYGTTRLTRLQFLYIVVTQQCVSDMRLRVLWGMPFGGNILARVYLSS